GRHPFESRYGPFEEVIDRMAEDRQQAPAALRKWNRAISPAVESIVRRCLEPNPTGRYQSARELQEDLQCQLAHQPLKHAPKASRPGGKPSLAIKFSTMPPGEKGRRSASFRRISKSSSVKIWANCSFSWRGRT